MIYALLAIICFIIVGIINRKIKKAKKEEWVSADLDEILIFDTETTGIFPDSEEILELAAINGLGEVLFQERFKPEKKKSWPKAQAIHGIKPADVKECKPISDYLP